MSDDIEKMELAVAWAFGEIGAPQAGHALGLKSNATSSMLYSTLLKAVRAGLLVRP